MTKDFFDEDLVSSGNALEASRESELSAGEATDRDAWQKDRAGGAVSDLNLTRLAREKRQLDGHVAGAVHEMEQLERRQKELEQRKARLEELARKQEEYERGKREMIEKLDRSIILMEKDEIQASKTADLLREMRGNFKEAVEEIRAINEEGWPAEGFEEELDQASVRLEEATLLYKKGINRIEAAGWKKGDWSKRTVAAADESPVQLPALQGFGYWLKVGLAVSLPLSIVLAILFVVNLIVSGGLLW